MPTSPFPAPFETAASDLSSDSASSAPPPSSRASSRSTTVFAVVGGIGSGKSFTTAALVARGAVRFDADAEARRLFAEPEILARLRERWGESVVSPSGVVDRARIAEIVFAPTVEGRAELDFLNATTRPPLLARYRAWRGKLDADSTPLAVLDAPLLFEVGWDSEVDYIVFVDASRATRERRVAERGWPPGELARREASQIPLDVKKARADFVVSADVDDSQMESQIARVLAEVARRRDADR